MHLNCIFLILCMFNIFLPTFSQNVTFYIKLVNIIPDAIEDESFEVVVARTSLDLSPTGLSIYAFGEGKQEFTVSFSSTSLETSYKFNPLLSSSYDILLGDSGLNKNEFQNENIIDTFFADICGGSSMFPEWLYPEPGVERSRNSRNLKCLDLKLRSPTSFVTENVEDCIQTTPWIIQCEWFPKTFPYVLSSNIDACTVELKYDYQTFYFNTDFSLATFDEKHNLIYSSSISVIPDFPYNVNFCQDLSNVAQALVIIYETSRVEDTITYDTIPGRHLVGTVVKRCQCKKYPFEELAPDYRDDPVLPGFDCTQVQVCDDPHFVQTVLNAKSRKPIRICYDVTGQSQQSIFILQDKLLNTRIEGVLLDDYYMHEIRLNKDESLLNINRKALEYKGKSYNWLENGMIVFKNLRIELKKETIKIEINDDENNELIIFVKKSKNKFGIEHLDISFGELSREKKRYEGIIGYFGEKNIDVLEESIQSDKDVLVEFDNKKLMGKYKNRLNEKCILLPFEKILGNENVKNYVY